MRGIPYRSTGDYITYVFKGILDNGSESTIILDISRSRWNREAWKGELYVGAVKKIKENITLFSETNFLDIDKLL